MVEIVLGDGFVFQNFIKYGQGLDMVSEQMKAPRISVIVPIYNAERYLRGTLNSLKNQTFNDFEVILIDDGSTDSSGRIADEFAKEDSRFSVYHIKNGGVSRARNFGLSYSKGEWIYCLDSDDIMESNMLEALILESFDTDMVVSSVVIEYIDRGKKSELLNKNYRIVSREGVADYLFSMNGEEKDLLLNYLWNRLMKREIISNANIQFDTNVSLGEDFLFISEYLKQCEKIVLLSAPLYHYCVRGSLSLAKTFYKFEYERRLLMRKALKELLQSFSIYEKAYDTFCINEGRYSIYGMEKINLPSCNLKTKEKYSYLSCFLTKQNCKYMTLYLRKAKGKNALIWRALIKLKNPWLIYVYLNVKKKLQGG